jgi:hypothetical protein
VIESVAPDPPLAKRVATENSKGKPRSTVVGEAGLIDSIGAGRYYLARGRNGCGGGTYGSNSAAQERTATICP